MVRAEEIHYRAAVKLKNGADPTCVLGDDNINLLITILKRGNGVDQGE